MKPRDLKPPFPQVAHQVAMHDKVWYVSERPAVDSGFAFPGWHHADFFGNNNPVVIEYCSGNGVWVATKAREYPHWNWVAVERKFDRVRKIWSKVKNYALSNLLILCGEALNATRRYIPDNSVQDVYLNFPDPWPKRRHIKNRLVCPEFAAEIGRILMPRGTMTFVTDDVPYSEWAIAIMQGCSLFISDYPEPYYRTEDHTHGSSYFEDLWRSKGKEIRYHRFCKC